MARHGHHQRQSPTRALLIAAATLALSASPVAAQADPIIISTPTNLLDADTSLDNQDVIVDGVTLIIDAPRRFRSLWLRNGAVVTHRFGAGERLELSIDEGLRIDPGCAISGTGRGGGSSPHRAPDGGDVRLVVGGVLSLDGWIAASGKPGAPDSAAAGGHGGSVQIVATALVGEGRIVACGGEANAGGGGQGGTVRIRVGTTRGVGIVSAVGAGGETTEPVLEVDVALFPGGGGAPTSRWAMWQVEGMPEMRWALVEE